MYKNGTGLNCTKTKLHECTTSEQNCTKTNFAPRVNFAQVTFLHESNKSQTNKYIYIYI